METEHSVGVEEVKNASSSDLISKSSFIGTVTQQKGVGVINGEPTSTTADVSSGVNGNKPATMKEAVIEESEDYIKPMTTMLAVLKNSTLRQGDVEESSKNDTGQESIHDSNNGEKWSNVITKHLPSPDVVDNVKNMDLIREVIRDVRRKRVTTAAEGIERDHIEINRRMLNEEQEANDQAHSGSSSVHKEWEGITHTNIASDDGAGDNEQQPPKYHEMVRDWKLKKRFAAAALHSSTPTHGMSTTWEIRPQPLKMCELPPVVDTYLHGKSSIEENMSPTELRAIKEISLLKTSKPEKYSPMSDSSTENENEVSHAAAGKRPRQLTGKHHMQSLSSPACLGDLSHGELAGCSDVLESPHYSDLAPSDVSNGLKQTGRWTKLEHSLFLTALHKYGKEWKKVAAMVRTRTVVQTRTHAQKYFQKVQKSTQEEELLGDEDSDFNLRGVKIPAYIEEDDDDSLTQLAKKPTTSRKRSNKVKVTQSLGTGASTVKQPRRKNISLDSNIGTSSVVMCGCGDFGEGEEGNEKAVAPGQQQTETPQHNILNDPTENEDKKEQQTSLPSPAACGSRKLMELAVAELLAAAAIRPPITPRAGGGMGTLTPLKIETSDNTLGGPSRPTYYSTTPWDGAVRQLSQAKRNHRSSSPPPILSPSEEPMLCRSVRNYNTGSLFSGLKSEAVPPPEGQQQLLQQQYVVKRQESPPAMTERCYIPEPNNYRGIKMGGQLVDWEKQHQGVVGIRDPHHERGITAYNHADGGDKELHRLTIQQDVSSVRALLESILRDVGSIWVVKDFVNQRDEFGFTPLMCAASLERSPSVDPLVRLLLQYGANPSIPDGLGNLAIHWAAYAGNENVVQLLLSHPYPPPLNTENSYGDTPLHFAARYARVGVVELLLRAGSNYNARNADRRTVLSVVGEATTGAKLDEVSSSDRNAIRKILLSLGPKQRTLVLYHPDCSNHQPRSDKDWERPERVENIICGIENSKLVHDYEIEMSHDFNRVSVEALSLAHSVEYILFVNNLSNVLKSESTQASVPFTPMVQRSVLGKENMDVKPTELCDTSFSAGSLRAVRYAAGAVVTAVDSVVKGDNRNAFCVVRPPGHHAGPNGLLDGVVSCGFCIFNNVVVGALHALEVLSVRRVAIVDLDVHHGNGTEELVRAYAKPDRMMFFSVHLHDRSAANNNPSTSGGPTPPPPSEDEYQFFPGTGTECDPSLRIINVPIMPMWKGDESSISSGTRSNSREKAKGGGTCERLVGRLAFRNAIRQILLPALKLFQPDLIFLSTGFDALEKDIGNCKLMPNRIQQGCDLTIEDYSWATSILQRLAEKYCDGRIVSVLEGGYGSFQESCAKKNRKGDRDTNSEQPIRQLDRTGLVEAAILHLVALIDPYSVLIDKV